MKWFTVILATMCLAAGPATRPSMETRLATVRVRADAIRIDGKADDWVGIPAFDDPVGDGGKKPALDATRTAIAPRQDDLLIVLHTAGRPLTLASTYAFDIDLAGSPDAELQVALGKPGAATALVYAGQPEPQQKPIANVQAAVAQVVEVRIPWASMLDLLPPALAEEIRQRPRPWVRVMPLTVDAFARHFADFGASAASYRLTKTPYDLDPPLPATDEKSLAMPLPVAGRWMIKQGAFGQITHHDQWAYDLIVVDNALRGGKVSESAKNEDYFAWDQSVTLPLGGRVIRAKADAPDITPPKQSAKETPVNEVYIRVSPETALSLSHFRQGTVTAKEGDRLDAGAALGRIGNSGWSSTPHLHIAAWQMPEGVKTVPIVLSGVRVGLNPVDDDYWARDLDEWSPREGMFVEKR